MKMKLNKDKEINMRRVNLLAIFFCWEVYLIWWNENIEKLENWDRSGN